MGKSHVPRLSYTRLLCRPQSTAYIVWCTTHSTCKILHVIRFVIPLPRYHGPFKDLRYFSKVRLGVDHKPGRTPGRTWGGGGTHGWGQLLLRDSNKALPTITSGRNPTSPTRPLGQQYNVGEKPTVILYIYINRHVGTREKH